MLSRPEHPRSRRAGLSAPSACRYSTSAGQAGCVHPSTCHEPRPTRASGLLGPRRVSWSPFGPANTGSGAGSVAGGAVVGGAAVGGGVGLEPDGGGVVGDGEGPGAGAGEGPGAGDGVGAGALG